MAWWRKKVVFPARRAWAAVSTRVRARKPASLQVLAVSVSNNSDLLGLKRLFLARTEEESSGGSILKLHEDVQTCGYKDVQVMFEILKSELEESRAPTKQRKPPAWRPPSAWSSRSSSIAAAQ
ncbi:hypothetical protein OsI_17278 [Oryza sativa Indica Group]|uniref:Uncharacterized protein n=2 Tax=Oryza sativa TaxID=4530 RepID=B9FCC1_ORYSJ|nr:hypothetical protein OsI_17278 [Oryza sativa Indica Group]EEE61626.1 hypothetical protein OsJ_16054 [Oryza sativa Japonica Group]